MTVHRRPTLDRRDVLVVEVCGPLQPDLHFEAELPAAAGQAIVAVSGTPAAVTDRRAADDARRQLAAIVGGSGDAIFGLTLGGVITSWNPAAERLFGYAAEEVIGEMAAVLAPGDLIAEQAAFRARLVAGGSVERFETVRRRKDGALVDVLITASTTTDEAGAVVGLAVVARDVTESNRARRALVASEHRLAESQRIAHLGSFEIDLLSGERTWSDEHYRILGLEPGLLVTPTLFDSMIHPDDVARQEKVWRAAVERGVPFDLTIRIIRADGHVRVVRSRALPEVAADGTVLKVAGTIIDETERAAADHVRRAAERRFEIGFEQGGIGAGILDLNGLPVRVNRAACAILGRPAAELVGRRWTQFSHPDDAPVWPALLERHAAGHDTYADERRYFRPDGTTVWTSLHVTIVRDDNGAPDYALAQLEDITARRDAEEKLAHRALHDSLTGLPNRALLTDRLLRGLADRRQSGSRLGVIFLDVDHFKIVNDSLGHTSGDDLLIHAADRIANTIRPGDMVARFGGDEFVVVCNDVTVSETHQIAERILAALSQPWGLGDQEMNVTASLGIAMADEHATPESLLRDSDAAMYRAKERGRGRIELFDEALRSKATRRMAIASALYRALERHELTVHYQPIVNLVSGTMVGVEALLRWNHPGRGLIRPDEFIPIAEETGLIVPIGAWVLEEACRELAAWQRLRPSSPATGDLSLAVNVSVRQILAPDIAGMVDDVLRRTGICPTSLWLELTESVFMEDVNFFGKTLADLKALGLHLSIDDFGTGYSSLSYLKRFPVDAVKVDRAFVNALGADQRDTALIAAIVAMAGALDLAVIAEGVETNDELKAIRMLGIIRAQGFYLARPMPAGAITRLVATGHHWPMD